MDIKELLDNPKYEDEFRVISFDKVIEKYTDDDNVDRIEMRFPYQQESYTTYTLHERQT